MQLKKVMKKIIVMGLRRNSSLQAVMNVLKVGNLGMKMNKEIYQDLIEICTYSNVWRADVGTEGREIVDRS